MRKNYYRKLSVEIITGNYQLVYQSRRKCEIYRDTGVSKNRFVLHISSIQKESDSEFN